LEQPPAQFTTQGELRSGFFISPARAGIDDRLPASPTPVCRGSRLMGRPEQLGKLFVFKPCSPSRCLRAPNQSAFGGTGLGGWPSPKHFLRGHGWAGHRDGRRLKGARGGAARPFPTSPLPDQRGWGKGGRGSPKADRPWNQEPFYACTFSFFLLLHPLERRATRRATERRHRIVEQEGFACEEERKCRRILLGRRQRDERDMAFRGG